MLQKGWGDVRRIDEEIRPEKIGHIQRGPWTHRDFHWLRDRRGPGQFPKIILDLSLFITPREVSVGLRKAEFPKTVHYLRTGKRLSQEQRVGPGRANVRDEPLPEREWLGVRVIHAENAHALGSPEGNDIAQRQPQAWNGAWPVEIDVDDVFVFLRRIFRIAEAAIRPPVEPFGVIAQPGMVGAALNCEVQREFQPMR